MDTDEKKKKKENKDNDEGVEPEVILDEKEKEHECQCEEYEGKYKRALADYQNLEKRTREERSEWIRSSGRDILLRLLPVLDTLSLANKHVEDQGLKVTLQQFLDVLKAEGIVKIDTAGKKFDPHHMEAIEMVEDPSTGSLQDGGQAGQASDDVIEEVREGYMLHDKLLRPAQVRVGKKQ